MDKQALLKQLIDDEGVRLKPYRDTAGKLTIGIGRNLDDRGISMSEATAMCENDINAVCNELDREIPWWKQMSEARQLVFANMLFNLGLVRFKGFKGMLARAKEGRYSEAADEMLDSKWAKQVGMRAARLAMMMRKG